MISPAKNAKVFYVLSLMLVTVVLLREAGIRDGTARISPCRTQGVI